MTTGPDNLLKWLEGELSHHLKADVGPALARAGDEVVRAGVEGVRRAVAGVDPVAKAKELVGEAVRGVSRILRF